MTKRHDAANSGEVNINRRSILSLLLCSCAFPAFGAGNAQSTTTYLRVEGQGDETGGNWSDAAPIAALTSISAEAPPGHAYRIGVAATNSPVEWEATSVIWTGSGTMDMPISIRFEHIDEGEHADPDRPPMFLMIGNETELGALPDLGGDPFVEFGPGTGNIHISGPAYDRSGGRGFFRFNSQEPIQNIKISDIHATNIGRAVESVSNSHIDGLLVENCSAKGIVRGFARFRSIDNAEFRNLDLDADFQDGGGRRVCQIISVTKGNNLMFSGVKLANAINQINAEERGSTYIQGDGLVLEEETSDVMIEDCHASEMGDGGFDLKSDGVNLRDCTAIRCKYGIRIWSQNPNNLIERCEVTEPVTRPHNGGACLWLGGYVTVRDSELHALGRMPIVRFADGIEEDEPAEILFENCKISFRPWSSIARGTPGYVEFVNSEVNGSLTNGRYEWTGFRLKSM